jgi:hypothetical protein
MIGRRSALAGAARRVPITKDIADELVRQDISDLISGRVSRQAGAAYKYRIVSLFIVMWSFRPF